MALSAFAGMTACICAAHADEPRTIWISGEVRAAQAEAIYVPPSNSSPVALRYFAPEGASVKPGDVLVRIDPGQSASMVRQTEAQLEQVRATAAKDIAALQVAAADAERALIDADAAFAKAKIDAAIPREHLSALDFDRYQGELERATREQALKQQELATANEAVERKQRDAALEADKLVADLEYHRAQVANSEQRAETAGTVVHGFDPWRGTRYDEGASANMGQRIGEVVGSGAMEVRAYALEPDRAGLVEGQSVALHFDAFPDRVAQGRIARISGAPDSRAQWGDGRYFTIDVEMPGTDLPPLLAGMSVRVEAESAAAVAEAP